jgi:hypothetical protein
LIPHTLPDYVERGGRQVWRPPFTARGAELYGFVLGADQSAIDALVQRDLVAPAGGILDYRCAHPNVIVTFAEISQLGSGNSTDKLRGYIAEREVAIWCLIADLTVKDRLLWYIPYVFTDSGQTVASGREVYGYPKQAGTFDAAFLAALEKGGSPASVEALAIDPYGPAQSAQLRPMISASRVHGGGGLGVAAVAGSWGGEVENWFPGGMDVDMTLPSGPPVPGSASIQPATAPPPPGPPPVPPWITGVFNTLQGKSLSHGGGSLITDMVANPMVAFLKQFRDATCPTKACYQAVIEAPIALDASGASYEALDPTAFAVTIADYASEPMASDLGLPAGADLQPDRVFHAAFNFDIELGLEVWRAPTS